MTSLALMQSVPSPIHSVGGLRPPSLPPYWPRGLGRVVIVTHPVGPLAYIVATMDSRTVEMWSGPG